MEQCGEGTLLQWALRNNYGKVGVFSGIALQLRPAPRKVVKHVYNL